MLNTVCFFEIPGDNLEELQKFYTTMFGWTFEEVPGKFRYYKIHMGQDLPKGGLTARQDAQHTPVNYVKVEKLDERLAKAESLGATVEVPKKPVPGAGWFAVVRDPDNNRVGMWEEDPSAG